MQEAKGHLIWYSHDGDLASLLEAFGVTDEEATNEAATDAWLSGDQDGCDREQEGGHFDPGHHGLRCVTDEAHLLRRRNAFSLAHKHEDDGWMLLSKLAVMHRKTCTAGTVWLCVSGVGCKVSLGDCLLE